MSRQATANRLFCFALLWLLLRVNQNARVLLINLSHLLVIFVIKSSDIVRLKCDGSAHMTK